MSLLEKDHNLGAEFEDDDARSFTRTIKIIGYARDRNQEIKYTLIGHSIKYNAVVTYHQLKPHLKGRKTTVSAKTLAKRYTKISH